ncbi:hypothetical protein BELL_0537g00070 [Botrytis elliptica]|uniref:WW domain-containing protein n=1 Tax=Botrytis elliptica TaxID=278938 RepID=A0A4Z1JEP8_9HELO|nr:hypothetical protein EAE99_009424 [Botrytis elliptica]TGO71734.1 hypothetical protein BELL_0537g00070 [Botrytis elliptica]
MAPYKYTQLERGNDEIRLLSLMPGAQDDSISMHIFHVPLAIPPRETSEIKRLSLKELQRILPDDMYAMKTIDGRYIFKYRNGNQNSWDHPDPNLDRALYDLPKHGSFPENKPEYEALSYIWGSAENPITAHVLGESLATIQIGASLAVALRQLRYTDKPRILWIDSICINQSDMSERSHEIGRMRNIFSFADRTIIWLGEEADDSTSALSTIEHFAKQVEYIGGGLVACAPGTKLMEWRHSNFHLPYDTKTWSSIRALFRRPWFSRVWVLQEALLGDQRSSVQCGNTSIPFTALRKAMLVLGRKVTTPSDIRSQLLSYAPGVLPDSMRELPELLRWAKHRNCSDPRDKIYGVLGLVSPLIAEGITCDYSIPVAEVYKSAVLSHVTVTKRLYLLQHCQLIQRFEGGLSWVPNWSFEDKSIMIGIVLGRYAAGSSSAVTKYQAPMTLEVTGVFCTRITSVKTKSSGNARETFQAIRGWEPEGLSSRDYIAGGSLIDAFLQTIYQGRTKERYPGLRIPHSWELRRSYLEAVDKDNKDEDAILNYVYGLNYSPTAFITTEEGYMGIGPLGVEEGDYVCVLLGTELPIVLRPTPAGEFLVVGSYFIHGLMDGEALLGPLPTPWKTELYRRKDSGYSTHFVKPNEKTLDDPRLSPLPSEWIEVNRDDGPWPISKSYFKHLVTGETMDSDPRMLPQALMERGVKLRKFRLV